MASVAFSCLAGGCTFKAPDANKPLGCFCDPRPNAYASCKYDACNYAGCRFGFFDLDGDPANGCEATRSQLPGNLVVPIGHRSHALTWFSESIDYFDITEGILTVTVSDPTCTPTRTHACDVRLEAMQLVASRNYIDSTDPQGPTEAILATSASFSGSQLQNGAFFADMTAFTASFAIEGDRLPLTSGTGHMTLLAYPATDGTVAVSLNGDLDGYVADQKGELQFNTFGKTPQLFDASAPDARSRDAQVDGGDAPDVDASDTQ